MGQETRAHPSGLTLLELPGFHLGEKVQVAPPMVAGLKSAPTQPIICPSVARGQQGPGDDPLVDARTDVHGPIRSGFREARASATLEASGFRRDQRFAEREPVDVVRDGKRLLWWFHDCFYWDDDGLAADDIKALVLQRERRLQQKLQTAHSLMRAEEAGRPTRIPIPTELRRAVFEARRWVLRRVRLELRSPVRPPSSGGTWRGNDRREPSASLRRLQPSEERQPLTRLSVWDIARERSAGVASAR